MKVCTQMRDVINALAAQHGLDFSRPGTALKLTQEFYRPLVIECNSPGEVSVTHYFYQNGDAIADPDILFYTGDPAGWMPLYLQTVLHYQRVMQLDKAGIPTRFQDGAYEDVVRLADIWAANILDQGWLGPAATVEYAQKPDDQEPDAGVAVGTLLPLTPAPAVMATV